MKVERIGNHVFFPPYWPILANFRFQADLTTASHWNNGKQELTVERMNGRGTQI
jgi:hypothetical protein